MQGMVRMIFDRGDTELAERTSEVLAGNGPLPRPGTEAVVVEVDCDRLLDLLIDHGAEAAA